MAAHVYERGVAATPYSSELWAHYATFKKGLPDATADDVRSVFERGLAYVGTDYNSQTLWDKYFAFEQERGSTMHIASLYSRVLACPVRDLDRYYTSFKNYIHPLAAAQIVQPNDYDSIRLRLESERAAEQAKAAEAAKAVAEAKAAEAAKAAADAKIKADAEAAAAAEAKAEAAGEAVMEEIKTEDAPVDIKAEGKSGSEEGKATETTADVAMESAASGVIKVKEEDEVPAANGDVDQPMEEAKQEAAAAAVPDAAAEADTTAPASAASEGQEQGADGVITEAEDKDAGEAAAVPETAPAAPPAVAASEPAEPPKPEPIVVTDEEIKQVWVRKQDGLYEQTKQELLRRKPFEDAARRPYFHIKPLDGVQLFNWIRYLDYVEGRSDYTATVTLYERCLVACANYPEFWQRYVRYLERTDPQAAKPALERAVMGFCKRRPEIHLFAAHFDERHGDVEGARARYKQLLNSVAPRLLEAVTAAANFERRQGNLEAACHYLSELMNEEKAKESSRIYPFLAIHYAHFLRRNTGDLAAARKVLDDALQQCPGVRSLWEAAIHFEELVGGAEAVSRALDLYNRCTGSPPEGAVAATAAGRCLPERDREELSARSVDFADMYGTIDQVKVVSARHAQRFMLPTTVTAEARAAASAKRVAEASAGAPAAKTARPEGATTASGSAAVAVPPPPPMMAPAAAAGYYPPGPPAAAAAAAAAAYSSYYGYGQYQAAPQYQGYGAYPGYGY
ncbi:hypothetical protein VOLCADRAFT_107666 [Volvox carteri f. nagariensis]|uniref:Suppressor of forked domain-containing protein n=1 Tax=Volvox carteri f. nagariensis TaxID=3068 RepID=D8UFI7_VOLCA|nr:uncharacterized protein VOLCADRAFT_107666 [Volvox carteri f. nagariensis]EFJ41464.1 hypothetical protein VOLCADRAFT_107666 [Volvox carteri f. nagariensis]|eukprot:XP_002957409.1 hypothetical protein VOLCADRAFT_107666 [Volvox carteri f. nagariensis]